MRVSTAGFRGVTASPIRRQCLQCTHPKDHVIQEHSPRTKENEKNTATGDPQTTWGPKSELTNKTHNIRESSSARASRTYARFPAGKRTLPPRRLTGVGDWQTMRRSLPFAQGGIAPSCLSLEACDHGVGLPSLRHHGVARSHTIPGALAREGRAQGALLRRVELWCEFGPLQQGVAGMGRDFLSAPVATSLVHGHRPLPQDSQALDAVEAR